MTDLAREMGVRVAPGMEPLSAKASAKLDVVLRDLDAAERASLAMMGAVGLFDWHLVDGVGRVWHFTEGGRVSWNQARDRELDRALRRAAELGWEESE